MNTYQQVTGYRVTAIPPGLDDVNAHVFDVRVEWRGGDTFAVCWLSQCLGSDGEWDYEPIPSSREQDWLATHRFAEEEALRLAHQAAPNVTVNGHTPAELLAKHRS